MFSDELEKISWEETTKAIYSKTEADVIRALGKSRCDVDDFMALISPAAEKFLEPMARLSKKYTEERFGRTMSMFIPLYITNSCTNSCVYCGFHISNPMARTILTNKLPIKIFLINNNGYHSIRLTQNNLFKDHCKIGIGPESGDLSFPEFRKIAEAFGYPYSCAHSNAEMKQVVDAALAAEGPTFCEIFTDTQQVWEPKSATKRLPDGTLVSPPLEDLAPFLPREELEKQMFIPRVPEQ